MAPTSQTIHPMRLPADHWLMRMRDRLTAYQKPEDPMPVSAPLPDDHPLMVAWKRWLTTADAENTLNWAGRSNMGNLWAAFMAGYQAAMEEAAHLIEAESKRREFNAVVSREIENREA